MGIVIEALCDACDSTCHIIWLDIMGLRPSCRYCLKSEVRVCMNRKKWTYSKNPLSAPSGIPDSVESYFLLQLIQDLRELLDGPNPLSWSQTSIMNWRWMTSVSGTTSKQVWVTSASSLDNCWDLVPDSCLKSDTSPLRPNTSPLRSSSSFWRLCTVSISSYLGGTVSVKCTGSTSVGNVTIA